MKKKAARMSPERRRVLGRTKVKSRGNCNHLRRTRSLSHELTNKSTNEENKDNNKETNENQQAQRRPMGARPKGFKRGKK